MPTYTPAMQQYIDIKKQHTDCILLFRIGDFYETFFEDAKICHKVLDLVITSKNKNSDNPIPMAGVPHHSIDKYIQKLVTQNYKVAIAEQTTTPTPGKIVEREVVSIITPATYIQEDQKDFNYITSITKQKDNFYIARGDFAIWEYHTKTFADAGQMQKFILSIKPNEIVFDIDLKEKEQIITPIQQYLQCLISVYEIPVDPQQHITSICNIQTIASFGQALEFGRLHAFSLLTNYLKNTQKSSLTNISKISLHQQNHKVLLDDITIKNLEIFASSYESNRKHSLIGILDNTKTTSWSRLLYHTLANPINDISQLNHRQNHITYFQKNTQTTKAIHHTLSKVLDLAKISSNILYRKLSITKFLRLRSTLDVFFEKTQNSQLMSWELKRLGLQDNTYNDIQKLHQHLTDLIKNTEDISQETNFVKHWYHPQIDELRQVAFESDKLLIDYQQQLAKHSKTPNLKIKFIKNQWYFIEITNKDIESFEQNLQQTDQNQLQIIRRNTLKWAQRYSSDYLNSIEQQILTAKEQLFNFEQTLLIQTKEQIANISSSINNFAQQIAWLDLYTAHAIFAQENNYNKPTLHPQKHIDINLWRHPVIEKFLPIDEQFIPNNLQISSDTTSTTHKWLHIITGPNMWGKSTFLRQNAIIVLMAHCGLFVPAQSAKISLIDWLFARIGSWDIIAKNQSTFMTEMIEVANILNNVTSQSFVIFDELGRGTSTYDGLALTKAILEHITTNIQCKTLIATHYHELIQLEKQYPYIQNHSVNVYETGKDVVFMKKIVPGWANKSYGLDVAKLAWIAPTIIQQAQQHLQNLEIKPNKQPTKSHTLFTQTTDNDPTPKYNKIKSLLDSFDINQMTPIQAIQLLAKLKDEIK